MANRLMNKYGAILQAKGPVADSVRDVVSGLGKGIREITQTFDLTPEELVTLQEHLMLSVTGYISEMRIRYGLELKRREKEEREKLVGE